MTQEEQLFGAPNRHITALTMNLIRQGSGACSVVVECQGNSQKRSVRLHVNVPVEQSPSHVLGLCAPLLHLHYIMPSTWYRHAMKVADRLGADGYEVSLA